MKLLRESRIRALWVCALLLTALPVWGQHIKDDPARLRLESASSAKQGKAALPETTPGIIPKTHVCEHFGAISCGQTLNGILTNQDCELNDGSFIDFWEFQGTNGQTVTVTLTSNDADSYLFLLNPDSNTVAQSDSGGGGTNARVSYTLTDTGSWAIGANAAPGETGNYTLSLVCSGSGGGGNAPAAPSNLRATAASSTEVELEWNDNSNNETSFRVEGRAGNAAFQDLGGVSASATGAIVTDLEPGTAYTFRVRARNASGDSPYSNQATVTTPGGGGGDGFITSPDFPDFRFRVRITPAGGSTITGARVTDCISETLCVSGAVAGRAEVFIRIIGPRPNGFLWPTIVRFTPSQVEVDIQQISTTTTKTYVLPAVPPNSDELNGLQDREGFLP